MHIQAISKEEDEDLSEELTMLGEIAKTLKQNLLQLPILLMFSC